ncbi:hypothetical protein [Pseudomonas fluorescens]|uniref:hypothetical protein n=1 Tax=Pseudomonas fluorescens TaxID=294 RepID=UPI001241A5BE|nr:hypothetical protein [Pseudomonas fluorescens]VVM85499.1 hypothetical protein PS639_02494 [Pseudomonas fluorescens]
MSEMIYLEVDRSNGAILSFDYEKLKSSTSDFIEATEAELNYLNHLENNVFPAGMVATLGDLQDYRAKVKALALSEAKVAQLKAKLAQSTLKLAQAKAAAVAARASMDAFMTKAAAERGISVPALESALADFKARNESRTEDLVYKNGKTRSETAKILQQMQSKSKRNN